VLLGAGALCAAVSLLALASRSVRRLPADPEPTAA
jgi:hypothetical protein